ncbi:MAG TPA: hypothetical protein VFJ77_03540 [Gaiellaceae bacterium]|nr:hypothetical protein [Gaiellaceae bacterium]
MTVLWHFSEDPTLGRFVPRDGKVWAIDDRHSWLYWFPRDCPRACFWAVPSTTDDDVEQWLDGDRDRRVAVIETGWLERLQAVALYAYRLPSGPFEVVEDDRFYIASTPVDAIERVELGNLLSRHAAAGVELRISPALYPLWDRVIETSLEFSGIRLRNAVRS